MLFVSISYFTNLHVRKMEAVYTFCHPNEKVASSLLEPGLPLDASPDWPDEASSPIGKSPYLKLPGPKRLRSI